jgi:hypothetical protein
MVLCLSMFLDAGKDLVRPRCPGEMKGAATRVPQVLQPRRAGEGSRKVICTTAVRAVAAESPSPGEGGFYIMARESCNQGCGRAREKTKDRKCTCHARWRTCSVEGSGLLETRTASSHHQERSHLLSLSGLCPTALRAIADSPAWEANRRGLRGPCTMVTRLLNPTLTGREPDAVHGSGTVDRQRVHVFGGRVSPQCEGLLAYMPSACGAYPDALSSSLPRARSAAPARASHLNNGRLLGRLPFPPIVSLRSRKYLALPHPPLTRSSAPFGPPS